MLRTYLYIPDDLEKQIIQTAKSRKISKAEVMRQALENGLGQIKSQNNAGVEVLFKLAEMGKNNKFKGPSDGSVNHDHYLWGLPKNNPKLKT